MDREDSERPNTGMTDIDPAIPAKPSEGLIESVLELEAFWETNKDRVVGWVLDEYQKSLPDKLAPKQKREVAERQQKLADQLDHDESFRNLVTILMLKSTDKSEEIASTLFGKEAKGGALITRSLSMFQTALLIGDTDNAKRLAKSIEENQESNEGSAVYRPYLGVGSAATATIIRDTPTGTWSEILSGDKFRGFGSKDLIKLPEALRAITSVAFYQEIQSDVDDQRIHLALEMADLAILMVEQGLKRMGASSLPLMDIRAFTISHPEITKDDVTKASGDKRGKANLREIHDKLMAAAAKRRKSQLFK